MAEIEGDKRKKANLGIFLVKLFALVVAFAVVWQTAVRHTLDSFAKVSLIARNSVVNYISEFGRTQPDKKLVVLTQEVTVEVSKEIDNRILWDWVSVGSANMKIKFIDNKVQYYVPLEEIKGENILYEPDTKTIKIAVPSVKIDKDMVFIQTNPNKVIKEENGSWSPFGPRLGELSNEIMSEINTVVLRKGYHELIVDKAKIEARKAMEEFFGKILDELLRKEGLKLQIIMP